MTTYQAGQAIKIILYTRDGNNELYDPDTVDSLVIEAPDKTILQTYTEGWTNSDTGIYYIVYNLPEAYPYVVAEWNYTHNSVSDLIRQKIEVKYV